MKYLAVLLLCCGCSLRSQTGTAFNLYDSSRYDEKRMCEGVAAPPGWCSPCQYHLNRLLDAVELGQAAGKRPGKAPAQKKRLKETSAKVREVCPQP